jgi:hypothetical protein
MIYEAAALVYAIRQAILMLLSFESPLDVLAQQIVAACAAKWGESRVRTGAGRILP